MVTHTVQRGESLRKIAEKYDLTGAGALIRANPGLHDPNLLRPGMVITIPGPDGPETDVTVTIDESMETYLVRSGDSIKKIAVHFGVSPRALIDANPDHENPDLIRPGQVLNVPVVSLGRKVRKVTAPPRGRDRPWFAVAQREMDTGVDEERAPGQHNPRILEYHATTTLRAKTDEVPWCSSFVNWCFAQSDVKGTRSARARSFEKWGRSLAKPKRGCVVVFWRKSLSSGSGHVGFFVEAKANRLWVLGGNQDDQVCIKSYPTKQLLGYRWPEGR